MAEITEKIESINNQLIESFGIDTVTGLPIWRVVWSEDQFEKRFGTYDDYTSSETYLRTVTEMREVPKYRQWIHDKYILERLVLVPEFNQEELAGSKLSYEPIWVFEDKNGNSLPPKFEACKFIVDTVYSAQAVRKSMITGDEKRDHSMVRYKDDLVAVNAENAKEIQEQKISGLMEELFGDESSLMGTTIDCGSSIIVPQTYKKEN